MAWFKPKAPKWEFEEAVEAAVRRVAENLVGRVKDEMDGVRTALDLRRQITGLQENLETLKLEKARKDEDFERQKREVEHKVGLERKRQEFEVSSAKREATLSVREENLKADRERFESQMKFQNDRFEKEVGYLKEMMKTIVERLPSARFTADLTPGKKSK